jgi:Trk K+ transport system NAD-binding subunit
LRSAPPPGGARIAVIQRGDSTIIPTGSTTLASNDLILLVTPRSCELDRLESWIDLDGEAPDGEVPDGDVPDGPVPA